MVDKLKQQKFNYIAKFTLVISVILLTIALWVGMQWFKFLKTPIIPRGEELHYIVKPGSSLAELTNHLQQLGYLEHPDYFTFLADFRGDTFNIKAGEYLFSGGTTPSQLLDQLVSARVVQHRFTIIEGWNFTQLMRALNAAPMLNHKLSGLTLEQILQELKIPFNNPEGLFYPATYSYIMDNTDISILKNAYALMQKKLDAAWKTRTTMEYQDSYQALITASLIEKETGVKEEKAKIASVILNRIKKGMRLQIDPTVIYSLGNEYTGKLKIRQLKNDSPYNTYKNKGLPPTPIAFPTNSSIQAALNPAATNDLFYVAKGDAPGHNFSETFDEHKEAVKLLREKMHAKKQLFYFMPFPKTIGHREHCCMNNAKIIILNQNWCIMLLNRFNNLCSDPRP